MLDLHSLGRKVLVRLETFLLLFGSPQQQIRTVISLPSNVCFFGVGGGHLHVLMCCSSCAAFAAFVSSLPFTVSGLQLKYVGFVTLVQTQFLSFIYVS